MLESAWLFIGVCAILATGLALYTNDNGVAMMMGVLGFVTWGVWTFGTLDVTVVGDSTTYSFTMPAVTILGIVLALVPGFIALTGPIDLIGRARRPEIDEV